MLDAPGTLPPISTKTGPHWAVKGLFWIALIWFVKTAQPFLAPIAVAVVLTLLLGPGVRALHRRGVPLTGGAAVMVGLLLLVLALIAGTLATPATQWWERAPTMVTGLLQQIDRARAALALEPPRRAQVSPPAPQAAPAAGTDPLRDKIASEGIVFTGNLLGSTVAFLAQATGTLLLLFFLLISEHWIVSRIVEAFPERRRRAVVLSGLRSAQRDISRFFGSLGLLYAGVGAATALGLGLIGLPNAVVWGVLTALINFIPYAGPVLITAMLFAAALVNFGVEPIALLPPLLFVALHMIEANLISPWFVAQRLLLSPVAVFLSVLFWAWTWGITGALIAVPMLVGFRSVCKRDRRLRVLHLLMQGNHAKPPSLRSLMRVPPLKSRRNR